MIRIDGEWLPTKGTRIYISGPMTGIENLNREEFARLASILRWAGYDVINPGEVDLPEDTRHEEYMRHDLKLMLDCTHVFVLPGFLKSEGAKLEIRTARPCGLAVHFLPRDWANLVWS